MRIYHFFDKLEDRFRSGLSRVPIAYGIVGGIAVVLFWRGIWHSADLIETGDSIFAPFFSAPISATISAVVLLLTGLFVSFFIGDRIILSGLTHEKKLEEKTESEVRQEGMLLLDVHRKLARIERDLAELKDKVGN